MKVTYEISLKENVAIENYNNEDRCWNIESSEVHFFIDEESKLRRLTIVLNGLPIKYDKYNVLNPYYPETKYTAYKVATYISNFFLFSSFVEVFDSRDLLKQNIEAEPETVEEVAIWNSCKKRICSDLQVMYSVLGSVNIDTTAQKYTNATPYSHYADGLRNNNIISSFEQYYKIIETYFHATGEALDNAVSKHAIQFNPEFTPQYVRDLRRIRNRCVHAQHDHGHITTDDLYLFNLVSTKIEELKRLCRCLIEKPIS